MSGAKTREPNIPMAIRQEIARGRQAIRLLARYAGHHEAYKAEPGTIDHEVHLFLEGLSK